MKRGLNCSEEIHKNMKFQICNMGTILIEKEYYYDFRKDEIKCRENL